MWDDSKSFIIYPYPVKTRLELGNLQEMLLSRKNLQVRKLLYVQYYSNSVMYAQFSYIKLGYSIQDFKTSITVQ